MPRSAPVSTSWSIASWTCRWVPLTIGIVFFTCDETAVGGKLIGPQQGRRPKACFAFRTRSAASSTRWRKLAFLATCALIACTMASPGATVFEMIMSPPADRKSMARVAGGMLATATVSPRSSEMMTPPQPSAFRGIWGMTNGGKGCEVVGIDLRVASQRHHHEVGIRGDPILEGLEVGIGPGRRSVGRRREVSIARDATEAGEVLERNRDPGQVHPSEEGDTVAADGRRVVPVLPLQRADRLVLRVRAGRDHIHHGGVVEVDSRRAKLLTPGGGLALQGGWGRCALDDRRGNTGKTRSLHRLDHAAFLVGRDEEPDIRGRSAGNLRLHRRGHRLDPRDACGTGGDKPDRTDVIRLDQVDFRGAEAVISEAELEQLTDPLIRGHGRKDSISTGERGARGRGR